MSKQTMKIRATVNNAPTTHHAAPIVPIKSTLEIAMAKAGLLVERDKPAEINPELVDMLASLEQQMLLLKAAIHHDKIRKGIITVEQGGLFNTVSPDPKPEIVIPTKSKFYLDEELVIGRCLNRAKAKQQPVAVQAESVPADDFETPAKTYRVKAESKPKRDDHKAGKLAFVDTFRDAVMSAFRQTKPGYMVKAHTVNAEDPTSTKYRVHFELHHTGSTVVLNRLSKNPRKAFTVEIPLKGGKLDPQTIPAFAYELK